MEKALELQKQIRQNADEYRDFVKDLTRWEDKVKNDDKNLQTERRIEEKLPPIRKKVKKKLIEDDPQKKKEEGSNKRISSYDYDAWSKFDVEKACKNIDEDSPEEEMESESEDEEEQERIREERNIQHAHVEKEKGNQLFKEGKYEAAINRYTKAISLHAYNPILYANRGMALIKTEKYAAAEEDCSRSLELDPNYTKALARRATARRKIKKYSSALEDYKRLLSIEPKNKQALTEIAEIGKILAKENEKPKDISKEEVRISGAESKPVPNNEEKQKRRSNKPLKRIHIEEIGLEEEIANIKTKSSLTPATIPIPKVEVPLTVPSSSVTFEREFKRSKSDEELLYKYMKLIPVEQYSKLIQCIDVLLSPFLKILAKFYVRDGLNVHKELQALSTVRRFDMAMMFLARDDKKYIEELFNYISSAGYPTEQVTVKEIKKKYGMRV